jgi:hypothetical protein
MFALLLILIIFVPIALLPSALNTFFSSSELYEMGILMEDTGSQNALAEPDVPCRYLSVCI